MSALVVEVCRLDEVKVHPNADALELGVIRGWQAVIPKGKYQPGDLVTYVPIDSLVPREHADRWGISKYLSWGKDAEAGRVRCARLRGEPSFGVVLDVEDSAWTEGQDVREFYGIEKYVPPVKFTCGDAEVPHPLFVAYTDVENLRNFPDVLVEGEDVWISEKIHGTNSRVASIEGELMAGSMGLRRKRPENDAFETNTYWFPLMCPGVRDLLESEGAAKRQVILFGEVYGPKVQNLGYGVPPGKLGFRAFDVMADGHFLGYVEFADLCAIYRVETVPVLYRGPYEREKVAALAEGPTTLGAEHFREGIVVKPTVERTDPKVGRVCLKWVSDTYLLGAAAGKVTDSEDV